MFGNEASSKLTATEIATPVHLAGRFPVATGQGSLLKFSITDVIVNSHWFNGCKNFKALMVPDFPPMLGGMARCPGTVEADAQGPKPNIS